MTVVINGTTGITTPDMTSDGGLTADGVSFASGAPANTLVTTSGGNVGIGTSSPSYKLHVSQSSGVAAGFDRGDGSPAIIDLRTSGTTRGYLGAASSVPFIVYNSSPTELMRIDSSGNLLVNTTSATGSAKFVVAADTTTANPMAVSNTRSTAATDYSVLFYRNASLVGSIQTSLSATSYVTSSDYRLKENIAPMTGALQKVAQLKPCTYTWKLDGSDGQGFIAHELQTVVPDCVTGEKDAVDAEGNPVYQGVDTSFLVATLTAAIQEQQAIIEQLRADVAALKAKA